MTTNQNLRIGFLGAGAMGEALAAGVIRAGTAPEQVRVADPLAERTKQLEERHGLRGGNDNREVVAQSDVVVLAVKPGLVAEVLAGVREEPRAGEVLWISIAAGVRLASLEAGLPAGARIIRAMPNTPALVAAGATAFVANPACRPEDRARAKALFEAVGLAWEMSDEALLDAVTGLSGSGPAYVFVLLEALADAGTGVGLSREAAGALATQTVYGAAKLALETGRPPAALRDQVSSPGGTTVAGLEALERGGLRAAVAAAVDAATARSKELGEA